MARVQIPFTGEAYNLTATQVDAQNCINWFPSVDPTGKFQKPLFPRPGLELFIDDDSEASVRGMLALKDVVYAVIDATFYIIYNNQTRANKGTLNSSVGNVSMTANDVQIFISDGTNGYVYQVEKSESREAGDFFIIENASSTIGTPEFDGTGIDDLSASGTYTGETSKTYRVKIETPGTPDTFRWSDDGGETYIATNVSITGSEQLLNDGVSVAFTNTTGHTANDFWDIEVTIDSAFYPPIIATFQTGYGIYPRQNSNRFYISAIDDFSQVNALDFASANAFPDDLTACISIHEELWLIGQTTTEIWYNIQDPTVTFPFAPRVNLVLNYGCEAPFTVKSGENNIIFMLAKNQDGDRVIVRIANYSVQIVSTEAINEELRTYEVVSDAYSYFVEWHGHLFYITTFPSADRTWVYDLSTGFWHEWRSEIPNTFPRSAPTRQGQFRGNSHVVFNGMDLIGDSRSGKIFKLSDSSYEDGDGFAITCERTCQHMAKDLQNIRCDLLQVDVESGVGLTTGQGSDPQLMLSVSKDGGKTWGPEKWRSAGLIGVYKNRALWYRLGMGRVFTFKLKITDPVYRVVIGAVADMDAGT